MAIVFNTEGGFREVPDPPKRKNFSYHISNGPSLTELFNALKLYPNKKVIFEISTHSTQDPRLDFISSAFCEVYVFGMKVLLLPMEDKDEVTIDKMENHWIGEGFIETGKGFKNISFHYDTKKRKGGLNFSIAEETQ